MKVHVYPADQHGCGHHRIIWPAEVLIRAGHDVTVITQQARKLMMYLDGETVVDVKIPDDVDVVVFQRVTHKHLAAAIRVLRSKGKTVVIDVDDDLSCIHPSNPAWAEYHPQRSKMTEGMPDAHVHSWANLDLACREASLVTATTPALLKRYAAHGRGVVLPNYLASHYYETRHFDSSVVTWPASLGSHPNDPDAVGNAILRTVQDGGRFHVISTSPGVGKAFGLPDDHSLTQIRMDVKLLDWPMVIASQSGIGIAPLADTKFNAAKSWLKPLELSAVGVPWIASPRDDYRRLHALGAGWLADKPSDWYKKLKALRGSPGLREELAGRGREVADTLRLDDHAHKWWTAWRTAVSEDMADGTRVLDLNRC